MGRTVPTFCQFVEATAQKWRLKFRRALRREDQEHFDRLFRSVRTYTHAATYQCSDNPMEAILISIALDQEKRLAALEKVVGHEPHGMDSGSLPLPAGDGAVAADAEPDHTQTD